MEIEAQICQSYNINCDFNPYPVIVYGSGDLPQTTQHISYALQAISPGFKDGEGSAPNFLKRIWRRSSASNRVKGVYRDNQPYYYQWYELEQPCLCDRLGGPASNGDGLTCDEYPFASTDQGGKDNYDEHRVSLRLVPDWEQLKDYEGSQFYKMGQFYYRAEVIIGAPRKAWFGVETTTQYYSYFWSQGEDGYRKREFTGDAMSF